MELVVWVSGRANEASSALQALKKDVKPSARNAAVLIRDRTGQIVIFETGEIGPGLGMLAGVVVGLLMELPGGSDPSILFALAADLGFPEGFLEALRADLRLGGSALVLLLDSEWLGETLALLTTLRGRVWRQALSDHLVAKFVPEIAPEGR